MWKFVVPAGIAAIVCLICTFIIGLSMRPVRKRYKIDLLPAHKFFAFAAVAFALTHFILQKL